MDPVPSGCEIKLTDPDPVPSGCEIETFESGSDIVPV